MDVCEKCGAAMKPSTKKPGKFYCSAFCWLTPEQKAANEAKYQASKNNQSNNQQQSTYTPVANTDEKVRSMAISYAKDMIVSGAIKYDSLYTVAEDICNWIKNTSQEAKNIEKVFNNPQPAPQDVNPSFNQDVPNEMPPMSPGDQNYVNQGG
jgi:hypothetical protein